MTNNIKYTSDGRKVVVVGNLNSYDKIVQEIFIVDGSEIPSGEHFVVTSLHDAPAVSWKEKNLKDLEERYEKEQKKYSRDIDDLNMTYRSKCKELREKITYIGSALKNANEKSFETLVNFITGEIEWIVLDDYRPAIIPINEFNVLYEGRLRLMSIFGNDDGTFNYAVGDYYDFSGGNKRFIPFKNHDEAIECFADVLSKKTLSKDIIELAKKHSIQLPEEKLKGYKEEQETQIRNKIKEHLGNIERLKSSINELEYIYHA